MRLTFLLLLVLLLSGPAHAAVECTERDLEGPYGILLSGVTTISGAEKPIASLARIEFDGHGSVSGSSSVNFDGLLLGNPVTGSYKVGPDCTVTLNLQDDSGAFQHFSGRIVLGATLPGGSLRGATRVAFRQIDPGTGERGVMAKTTGACTAETFRGRYSFTLSGAYTPLAEGGASGRISAQGTITSDGAGKFSVNRTIERNGGSITMTAAGTFDVDSDCIINLNFTLPSEDGEAGIPMKLRGILVNDGKEIFAIQTTPGETLSVQFTRP